MSLKRGIQVGTLLDYGGKDMFGRLYKPVAKVIAIPSHRRFAVVEITIPPKPSRVFGERPKAQTFRTTINFKAPKPEKRRRWTEA